MTRREQRRYAAKLAAEDWERSRPWEPCAALEEALDTFYDDPITLAYGATELDGAVVEGHMRRHVGCPGVVHPELRSSEPMFSYQH